jgi:tRNA A-37 threonylcarbamoyl transferase component Bud32
MNAKTPEPPERIIRERYRVLHLLGEGASARTLACHDLVEDRRVAIKELRAGKLESWKHMEMFEREAKALAGLRHHGIPAIHDFFEHEEPSGGLTLYLVQELVDGPSLEVRIGQAPLLGESDVLDITLGVLDILEYLHGRTPPLYHRDIKPSNIVLRGTGAPVLVDFGGICHGWRPEQSGGSTVTGTYGYMPPEQLMGRVSPQSDLYALGATLLYVVTGREPTDFDFDAGRLSVPEAIELRPSLRRAIDAMLAPAPRDRPRTAKEVRGILLGVEAPVAASSRALVPVRRGGPPAVMGGDAPRWIDVGPPPRDPHGELADVYRNLIEPLDDTRESTGLMRVLGRSLYVVLGVFTLGVVPAVYYAHVRKRRRRYDPVFRNGVRVDGTIVSVEGSEQYNMYATIGYEYEVQDQVFRAFIDYPVKLKRYWTIGDRVAVLHDPDDPVMSCVVFRC